MVAKDFGHKSLSRNPKIFELFTRMDLVEKVGSGIPRMADEMREAHLPSPEYKTDGFFTTILYKAPAASPESGESKEKNQEKSKEKTIDKVFRLIKENPNITTAELAAACGLGENTIYKAVRKLREDHAIEREGGDRGGYWKILR